LRHLLNLVFVCQMVREMDAMAQEEAEEKEAVLDSEELRAAIDVLRQLVPEDDISRLQRSAPNTVYTTLVTLWMLTLQRLGHGKSLEAVVKEILSHNRDLLPQNKRVQEGTLSCSSAAYSGARQRLKLATVEHFAQRVSDSLIEASLPLWDGRRMFIIDGTTITLAPTPELQEAFPPATNQHGETVWPVALLMVAHELQSGCALPPEIGAMYGDQNTSEAKLARAIALRIPPGSIVLADSGFGIFAVVYHFASNGRPMLFRLTKARFKALRRRATLLEADEGGKIYQLHWMPSAKDRKTHPELPEEASVDVFLHEIRLAGDELLFLVTMLPISYQLASDYYSRRYDVEHDIRDIKVAMDTENIRAQSVDMVRKELLTSIVAYNLVVQFRRQAARQANVLPRELSFTRVWDTFCTFLIEKSPCDVQQWQARFTEALRLAAQYGKLPKQSKPRHSPRRAHPRRPKSTKFIKQQRTQNNKASPTDSTN
jgi:hypothetical protein